MGLVREMNIERTMELKVGSSCLPRELLLPFLVLLDGPLPVLLPLDVLATFLRIRFRPKYLGELTLLFESCKVARSALDP